MKAIFVAIQNEQTRAWTPVGRLTKDAGEYIFEYTKGAEKVSGFQTFGRMKDLHVRYVSPTLFPLFANRRLPKSRPEYAEYLDWLGLTPESGSDLEELGRTNGRRATDGIELIPCPEADADGLCELFFFSRGIRHAAAGGGDRVAALKPGEKLYLCRDVQNSFDEAALILRTDDPVAFVGYLPAYFTQAFSSLIDSCGPECLRVVVEKVNSSAPTHYRLLCRLTSVWPKGFEPFSGEDFQPLERLGTEAHHGIGRVNLAEPYEVAYWTKALGISERELRDAVDSAGASVPDVRNFVANGH